MSSANCGHVHNVLDVRHHSVRVVSVPDSSSASGGGILTAGEKGKHSDQYTAVGIAIVNTEIANTRW